ncbi:MAG: PilZ domain-containing protein, partial [Pseudomonadota bacterium]
MDTPYKQRATRVPVRFPVSVEHSGQRTAGVARDLSRSGMFLLLPLLTNSSIKKGDSVVASFVLPFDGNSVQMTAVVVWKGDDSKDHRGQAAVALGLQFAYPEATIQKALKNCIVQYRVTVLLVAFDNASLIVVQNLLAEHYKLIITAEAEEALGFLDENDVGVMCIGTGMIGEAAKELLEKAGSTFPGNNTLNVVLAAGADPSFFQDFIDTDDIYYLTMGAMLPEDLVPIIHGAVEQYLGKSVAGKRFVDDEGQQAIRLQRILELSRRLVMQQDVESVGQLAIDALEEVVDADRAYYLIYDFETQVLWTKDAATARMREESAAAGLVSFVGRTGVPVAVEHIGYDPRYDKDADDPYGRGDERFLAQPVVAAGWVEPRGEASKNSKTTSFYLQARMGQQRVLAILVAVREASRPMFSQQDKETLGVLAKQVASAFGQMDLKKQIEDLSSQNEEILQEKSQRVFRKEALDHYTRGERFEGEVLRVSPGWTRWTYWLIVLLVLAGLFYAVLGHINEYARGPAIVRVEGRTLVTAVSSGTVDSVEVNPGARVAANQLLV